jgi:glycosyltransferase involved in cell wall biosynthesis
MTNLSGPLRILHVTPYSGEAWAYGGIPRLARTLTRGLARRGHHVTVCTTDACDESTRLPPSSLRAADGVDVRIFPNLSNRLAYRLQLFLPIGLETYLRQHAATFDVAHLHACRNAPGAIAAYHLQRTGVPYVLAPNGTAPRIERRRLAKRAFDVVAGRRIVRRAACVLAVSGAERAQFQALGIDPAAIRLIPNPIDLDEFTQPIARGNFRRRVGLPACPEPSRGACPEPGRRAEPAARVVLFLGKLTPRKRLDVLVRAFARLERSDRSDTWLVIAGNDMGAGTAARSLVAALGLRDRTLFTGLLRGHDRLDALADADVLVYPSQDEIFGLVPLEALLSGTPAIVADDSGCGEVVRAIGGGQVVPLGDVDALARAIDRVLGVPSDWRAAAAEAATRARAAYGDDVVCAQLEHLYGDVIASA